MQHKLITTLDLMRHGEPIGGRKYRGQIDDPLSEKGWAQMRAAVGDHCPWQVVISSPLLRCVDFARELAGRHGIPLEVDDRLVELGFGSWEGRSAAELTADNPDCIVKFHRDPLAHAPPGAEPLSAFRQRVIAAWNSMFEIHLGQHLLVVAHAGVIRMMVAHTLNSPLQQLFRLQVSNASITRIRATGQGESIHPQLLFHGGSL